MTTMLHTAPRAHSPPARGFSLVELMVAVAIVAIITSIAIPSYRHYVLQGNRTDAIKALTYYQQALSVVTRRNSPT